MSTTSSVRTGSSFSVCQSVLSNVDMASDLRIVTEAGVGAIALLATMVAETGESETVRLVAESGLNVSTLISSVGVLAGARAEAVDALHSQIDSAVALGAPGVLVFSAPRGERSSTAADDEVVARLEMVAPHAVDRGVTLALEPIHPFLQVLSYVNTFGHAVELVERVPGVKVLVDTAHVFWDREITDAIRRHIGLIASVQLSSLSAEAVEERRWVRSRLDDGVVPVEALVRTLHDAGFRGYYENEIIASEPVGQCVASVRAAREWFDSLDLSP